MVVVRSWLAATNLLLTSGASSKPPDERPLNYDTCLTSYFCTSARA